MNSADCQWHFYRKLNHDANDIHESDMYHCFCVLVSHKDNN